MTTPPWAEGNVLKARALGGHYWDNQVEMVEAVSPGVYDIKITARYTHKGA